MLDALQYGWQAHFGALLLMMIGAFLLAWLLRWWFWERGKTVVTQDSNNDLMLLRSKNTDLDKELASARYRISELEKQLGDLRVAVNRCEADKAVLEGKLARSTESLAFAKAGGEDGFDSALDYSAVLSESNLQIIEGVGPSTERTLKAAGINTWTDLSATDADRIKSILSASGLSLKGLDIDAWKKQAHLAKEGNWDVLVEYQKDLDIKSGASAVASKAERMAMVASGFPSTTQEDLEFIYGIDRNAEIILKDAGIHTWADLVATDAGRLRTILDAAGYQYDIANVDTWADQASMAINGDWVGLRNFQSTHLSQAVEEVSSTGEPELTLHAAAPVVINYSDLLANDNLQIIEGIGLKTEYVLQSAGIKTWADLMNIDEATLKAALNAGNVKLEDNEIIASWKYQAQLANSGNWEGLFQHQKDIDKIKPSSGVSSKAERFVMSGLGFPTSKRDLELVSGITPEAEAILYKAGVNNWSALSKKTPIELKKILDDAGYAYDAENVDTWANQAALAVSGNWGALKGVQNEETGREILKGGLTALAGVDQDTLRLLEENGIGSIEVLAQTDDETLMAAFANSKNNWNYLKNQAIYANSGDWNAWSAYKADSYAYALRPDNLEIIEGIGPKIDELLKAAGIKTWSQLATNTTEQIRAILEAAGSRYKMHDPKTWSEQAKLAADGNWKELVQFQKYMDTSKEAAESLATPSKVEKLMVKLMGISAEPDDLKVVEGIGLKIEELLKNAGILSLAELAETSTNALKKILEAGGGSFKLASPDTWQKQAELAAAGKWVELLEYQNFLQGGKDEAKA